MAELPYMSCPVPGCPEYSRGGGRCEKHRKQLSKKQKSSRHNDPRYNKASWKKNTKAYRISNPLCEQCLKHGITKKADMVHHIKPISEGGDMFAWSNLESLCWACHGERHK